MKILFLTHEGYNTNIVTTQVVKHCEALESGNLKFGIITVELNSKTRHLSARNYKRYISSDSPIIIKLFYGFNPYLPLNILINLCKLFKILKQVKDYDVIHARSDYTAFLCNLMRPQHKLSVIWDCRGDFIDELRLVAENNSLIVKLFIKFVLIP